MTLPRRPRRGFNLVEIMITLTLVALLTTVLINFVNDFDDKAKMARARNDITRIAQQAVIAESRTQMQLTTESMTTSGLATMILDYIVELPDFDPWGNRFVISADGTVRSSSTEGIAYVIDPSFGRVISAGPDGVINTQLGTGKSEDDLDLVVEFRQQPWVAYSGTPSAGVGEIHVAKVDGSERRQVLPRTDFEGGTTGIINVTFSPDGSKFCGVAQGGGAGILCGLTSADNPAIRRHNTSDVNESTFPMFMPDGQGVLYISNQFGGELMHLNLTLDGADEFTLAVPTVLLENTVGVDDSSEALTSGNVSRFMHVSRQRSYYTRVDSTLHQSITIAVGPDGKIAVGWYPDVTDGTPPGGIYLLLPGVGNKRLIKADDDQTTANVGEWFPLFWVDSNNLIYWGVQAGEIHLRRIGADGRFDIPLMNPTSPVSQLGSSPIVNASISPDGDLLCFIHNAGANGKILRADGGGYLKGGTQTGSNFSAGAVILSQPPIFARHEESLYFSAEVAGIGIQEVKFLMGNLGLPPQDQALDTNGVFDIQGSRIALGPNGLLIAAIQSPDINPPGGVKVFPILGPEGTSVEVSEAGWTVNSGVANQPNVVWIDE